MIPAAHRAVAVRIEYSEPVLLGSEARRLPAEEDERLRPVPDGLVRVQPHLPAAWRAQVLPPHGADLLLHHPDGRLPQAAHRIGAQRRQRPRVGRVEGRIVVPRDEVDLGTERRVVDLGVVEAHEVVRDLLLGADARS